MWVYWGKLGHLETGSQEGAVLGPHSREPRKARWEGLTDKVTENMPWPLLLALERQCPHLSRGREPGDCP